MRKQVWPGRPVSLTRHVIVQMFAFLRENDGCAEIPKSFLDHPGAVDPSPNFPASSRFSYQITSVTRMSEPTTNKDKGVDEMRRNKTKNKI